MTEPRLTETGDGCWSLEGELNFSSVSAVLDPPFTGLSGSRAIQVDLKGVTRADSAGLALLLEWLRASERAGKLITFINVPGQLLAIAGLCGIDEILSFNDKCEKSSNDR